LAARRTIKMHPRAAAAPPAAAEIVGSKTAARTAVAPAVEETPVDETPAEKPRQRPLAARSRAVVAGLGSSVARRMRQTLDPDKAREAARRALGGRLELLGGALGPGWAFIRRVGPETRLGFLTADGFVDLETQLQAIRTAPDRAEHRILSAVGWGWTAASLFGAAGAVVVGGIRLMHPRLTIVELALRDGRNIVARTDGITAAALSHLAGMPSWRELPAAS
jgi:hypothetical protein